MKRKELQILTEGGIMIALSIVLGFVRLYRMPQGGSVTAGQMVPLIFFALRWGLAPGLLAGTVYGILDALIDGYVIGIPQFLLDYPLAFACLGLAGLFHSMYYGTQRSQAIVMGASIAVFGRFVCHVLSGVIFFAEYAEGSNVWLYSMGYNGSFLAAELVIAVILLFVLAKLPLERYKTA
ncbi:MAG: energy-coupled thiamine transporter ThiT [Tissierellia bacterium]|nr:energy-coupled thiamine transporter ThiT [Tissierellia bacterium]